MKTLVSIMMILTIVVMSAGFMTQGAWAQDTTKVEPAEAQAAAPAEPTAVQDTVQAEPKITTEKVSKTVVGEVSGRTGGFIAVLYGNDKDTSYEIALNVDEDVKIINKKSFKDISQGDTVSVNYEETIQTKEGEKPRVLARVVKEISFIRPAPKESDSTALVAKD